MCRHFFDLPILVFLGLRPSTFWGLPQNQPNPKINYNLLIIGYLQAQADRPILAGLLTPKTEMGHNEKHNPSQNPQNRCADVVRRSRWVRRYKLSSLFSGVLFGVAAMTRRIPEHARGALMDRPPVATYEQALAWLMRAYDLGEKPFSDFEELPDAAYLVQDMFWVTERQLRLDLRHKIHQYNQVTAPGPSARRKFARAG